MTLTEKFFAKETLPERACAGCPKVLTPDRVLIRVAWARLTPKGGIENLPNCESLYCCGSCARRTGLRGGLRSQRPCDCRMPRSPKI